LISLNDMIKKKRSFCSEYGSKPFWI
jgi:hypothetical protein